MIVCIYREKDKGKGNMNEHDVIRVICYQCPISQDAQKRNLSLFVKKKNTCIFMQLCQKDASLVIID